MVFFKGISEIFDPNKSFTSRVLLIGVVCTCLFELKVFLQNGLLSKKSCTFFYENHFLPEPQFS